MSETTPANPAADPASPTPPNRRRKWAFRLGAILIALVPFILLEAGLRILDVGRPTEYDDPFVGFSELHPQFELNESAGRYETAMSRHVFFNAQEFTAQKPKNGFRAFCLGGSTVYGRPYTHESAFPHWLQLELAAGDARTQYEIVNCGGISYASYRLKPMLKEVLQYQPDLIVIATGHNEFLEDRTYGEIKQRSSARQWFEEQVYSLRTVTLARRLWDSRNDRTATERTLLPDKVNTILDGPSGYASYHRDEKWRRDIATHFDHSLRSMVAMCREAGVPVVLVRLGSNLRDCPPLKSEHKTGLSDARQREWQRLFDEASEAEKTDLKRAVDLYRQAEKIDNEHALLCYRLAGCLDRLGKTEDAHRYYGRAKEEDICPLRLIESLSKVVETVATETETPLVDALAIAEQMASNGIPGNDLFLDHVHPTIAGHQQIAQSIVRILLEKGWSPDSFSKLTHPKRRSVYRRHFDRLGPAYLGTGNTRVGWLENWAKRERLLQETYPKDHRARLRYGSRLWDLGQKDGAWTFFDTALKEDKAASCEFLLQRGLSLFVQGRAKEARTLLERLSRHIDDQNSLRDRWNLARLILAVELNDATQVLEILREAGNGIATLDMAQSAWLKEMPDALTRARSIAEQ